MARAPRGADLTLPGRILVAAATSLVAAAVVAAMYLLLWPDRVAVTVSFFFCALAAATIFGSLYPVSALANLAGGLAAGWVAAVAYLVSGSVTGVSWELVTIEVTCVAAGPSALDWVGRRRLVGGRPVPRVLAAAAVTPFMVLWYLHLLPAVLLALLALLLQRAGRRPAEALLAGALAGALTVAGERQRLLLGAVAGLLAGLALSIVGELNRRRLDSWVNPLRRRFRSGAASPGLEGGPSPVDGASAGGGQPAADERSSVDGSPRSPAPSSVDGPSRLPAPSPVDESGQV